MGENGDKVKFVGMTKDQFLGVALSIVIAALLASDVLLAFSTGANSRAITAAENTAASAQAELEEARALTREIHRTQCAQKEYAQKQVEATANFLATNTEAEPFKGVTRGSLIDTLHRQRKFRDSFSGLDCG